MEQALVIIGGLGIIVFLWSTIMIHDYLRERNIKVVSFFFINLFIFRYVSDYRIMTRNKTGKTGYLFYLYIISINVALLCAVILVLMNCL